MDDLLQRFRANNPLAKREIEQRYFDLIFLTDQALQQTPIRTIIGNLPYPTPTWAEFNLDLFNAFLHKLTNAIAGGELGSLFWFLAEDLHVNYDLPKPADLGYYLPAGDWRILEGPTIDEAPPYKSDYLDLVFQGRRIRQFPRD